MKARVRHAVTMRTEGYADTDLSRFIGKEVWAYMRHDGLWAHVDDADVAWMRRKRRVMVIRVIVE